MIVESGAAGGEQSEPPACSIHTEIRWIFQLSMVFQTQMPISLVKLVIAVQDLYMTKLIIFTNYWLSVYVIVVLWFSKVYGYCTLSVV